MRALGLVSRVVLLTSLLAAATAPALARAEPAERAYVGVYLHDVTHFDQRNGTFVVDADVWLKWSGELDASLLRVQNGSMGLEIVDLGETSEGDWHSHRYHIRGSLRGEFPLQRFPFDVQVLGIQFELLGASAELVPDLAGSGIATNFSVTGWNYEPTFHPRARHVVYPSDLGTIDNEGRSTKIDRVGFEVTLERPTVTIAVKLFLPLVLLLMIALIALFLAPDLVDARSGIGVTVLLACFAFQFTIAGTIPDVSYLTVVDKLFILAYALATLTLIITVAAYWLHRTNRVHTAVKMDRWSRVLIPVGAVIAAAGMLSAPPSLDDAASASAAALPSREPSARDVLRVGTLQLKSHLIGLVGAAQQASLTTVSADGETTPVLAVDAPSVANDQLDFHADGTVEVRWALRPGLRWSDGQALTSDDFRFALEVSPDSRVTSVDTPDDRTMIITYSDALADALEGFSPLPRHALEATRRDGGFDAVRAAQDREIIPSAGPYRLVEFVVNRSAVLESNPHFSGSPPSIGRIEVLAFRSTEALAAAFQAGAVDILVPGALTPAAAKELASLVPEGVIIRASDDLYALVPDESVEWLARPTVRRAILQAIDRASLATTVFGELGAIAETTSRGLDAAAEDRVLFDPVAARAAFEEAGVLGATLRLTHTSRPLDRRMAELLVEQLVASGLVVDLHMVAPDSADAYARDHGGLMLSTIQGSREDLDPRRFWSIPRVNGRYDAHARTSAFNQKLARLVDQWSRSLYPERRAQLVRAVHLAAARRLPLIPLVFGTERVAVVPALRGWDGGLSFGANVADWHFVE